VKAFSNRPRKEVDDGPEGMMAPEEALKEAGAFFGTLPTADKLALAGAALVVLFSFFPWKETAADGEVLGLLSTGAVALGAAVALAAALLLRSRKAMPSLGPVIPWLIQLAAAAVCVVSCLVFIKASWDGRRVASPVGNYELAVSRPSFGVVVGLIGGLVALGGTLMGLKDKAV
jgi:hypothetical protein